MRCTRFGVDVLIEASCGETSDTEASESEVSIES